MPLVQRVICRTSIILNYMGFSLKLNRLGPILAKWGIFNSRNNLGKFVDDTDGRMTSTFDFLVFSVGNGSICQNGLQKWFKRSLVT